MHALAVSNTVIYDECIDYIIMDHVSCQARAGPYGPGAHNAVAS